LTDAKIVARLDRERITRVRLDEPRGLFDDLFGMAGGGPPVARLLAAGSGSAAGPERLVQAAILARATAFPGLDGLASEAGALVQCVSGRPLLLLPMRVRVR
ncbi:MAG: hypothetical protein ACKOTB_15065, partial [Planctomycetia bacterium]